jgi:hypothetical protein
MEKKRIGKLKRVLTARCLYTNKSQEALCKADETDIATRVVTWVRKPRTIRYNFILMITILFYSVTSYVYAC